MEPNIEVIHEYISAFFKEELINYCLYWFLFIVAILASICGFKIYAEKSLLKAVFIVILLDVCAMGLIFIKTTEFLPVYEDYKNKSYTIEYDSKVWFEEGMNNPLEQKNTVQIITKKGNKINLSIVHDYKFETEYNYTGTIIYTTTSKHVIWYDLS